MTAFSAAIVEIELPHVTELDLSSNDFTAAGLEVLGGAIAKGAVHALQTLNLSDCSGLRSLPDSLAQLRQLKVLKLDGCLGLSTFPPKFAELASLRTVHASHCQKLLSNEAAIAILPSTVQVVQDRGGNITPPATPKGTAKKA